MHNHSSTSSGGGGAAAAAAAAADDDGPSLFVFVPNQSQKGSCSNSQKRDASFLSGPSASPFLGSRSMMSFEDGHGSNNRSFFRPFDHDENGDDEYDDFFHQPEKKRRLAIDQVQFLEKSFEFENKLEPERKVQLAKDLGLQPRQVAIWFQNRRARWKNKQLEKDYDVLQNCYNSLKADYDNLLKEKDELRVEVLMLSEKLQVKEKGGRNTELPAVNTALPQEPAQVIHNLRVADSAASHGEMCNVSIGSPKPEDLSSAKSDIFDSDSPHYADGVHSPLLELEAGDSSYVFEPEQSDLSQDEDDSLSKNVLLPPYIFPKLEEADYSDPPTTSCNFGFPIEDHAFWSWSY